MDNKELTDQNALTTIQDEVSPGEIVIGTFQGFSASGEPLVDFPQNTQSTPLPAISTIPLMHQNAGRQIGIMFAQGDWAQPILIGFIHSPLHEMLDSFELTAAQDDNSNQSDSDAELDNPVLEDVKVDGQRVVIEGKDEVVFKCGEASITLTKAGKIMIRGKYLLNRSSGVNRIMGGSVQVN